MTGVSFKPLTGEDVLLAFPLVRELDPALDLESWRAEAERLVSGEREGMMTARRNGFIRGLFRYRVKDGEVAAPELRVNGLVVMDMFGQNGVAEALVAAARGLAHSSAAALTVVELDDPDSSIVGALLEAGFTLLTGNTAAVRTEAPAGALSTAGV